MNHTNYTIAIIGLGYVGLPLALAFSKKYAVIGFDINSSRIEELNNGHDRTNEATQNELNETDVSFTHSIKDIKACKVYIITVPTPIDEFKKPDLEPLIQASQSIGNILKKGDTVIYESTVYPGCTEDDCVPVLEKHSGLKLNTDFTVGYSPERINPGDKVNTITTIKKVVSGSNEASTQTVADLYASIITAGVHIAPSIKVAEASKAIENAQRDVNISFVNELALMFDKMGIDTHEVLEAAGTKWNFLKFKPGLVGGHCIGVDPYYLMHKAESVGYFPQVILSGRRINDNMGIFVANKVLKLLIRSGQQVEAAKVLILGFAFKENCPDYRNTRVIDIVNELEAFGAEVHIYDPIINTQNATNEYRKQFITEIKNSYDAIILAVAHTEFLNIDLSTLKKTDKSVIFDTKGIYAKDKITARL